MALKRVFAGFYMRYDGKPIFVVRVLKDICENYRMDLRRYKLIRERKQYIGVSNREAYQAMCEDLAFAQQSLKTVLTTTPISSGNVFPRGCPSAKQRMPCSRTAA